MATDETTSRAIDAPSSPQRPPTAAEQRASEHAGTNDPDLLARDIAQTREELSVTIDAIVDRVSPKKVVERGKQQAREGVQDATEVVKGHATTAAGLVKEKALVATEVVKEKVAEVREKVSGSSDSSSQRDRLPAASAAPAAAGATLVSSPPRSAEPAPGTSPLPATTVSVDAGELPPPETAAGAGSLADAAEAGRPAGPPASASGHRRVTQTAGGAAQSVPPVYAGAAAAALLGLVLLLLRRRRS